MSRPGCVGRIGSFRINLLPLTSRKDVYRQLAWKCSCFFCIQADTVCHNRMFKYHLYIGVMHKCNRFFCHRLRRRNIRCRCKPVRPELCQMKSIGISPLVSCNLRCFQADSGTCHISKQNLIPAEHRQIIRLAHNVFPSLCRIDIQNEIDGESTCVGPLIHPDTVNGICIVKGEFQCHGFILQVCTGCSQIIRHFLPRHSIIQGGCPISRIFSLPIEMAGNDGCSIRSCRHIDFLL